MKKILSYLLAISILLSICVFETGAKTFSVDTLIELEKATIKSDAENYYVVKNSNDTSRGKYLYITSASTDVDEDTVEGDLEIEIDVPAKGTYSFFLRYNGPSVNSDSVFASVNDETLYAIYGVPLSNTGTEWEWKKIFEKTLNAGKNKFKLLRREPGVSVDALYVTADAAFNPDEIPISLYPPEIEEEVKEVNYKENILSAAGVLPATFSSQTTVKKVQLLETVMQTVYNWDGENPYEEPVFSDVPVDSAYAGVVKSAHNLGIVKGSGANLFNPEKDVTLQEAITVMVRALKHEVYAEHTGGYPTGYVMAAKQLGLLKGISESYNEPLSKETYIDLIYNLINSKVIVLESVKSPNLEKYVYEDITYLAKHFNIYKYNAEITDNGITSLNGSSIAKPGYISYKLENNQVYDICSEDSGIEQYLGCKAEIYVYDKDGEEKRLITFNNGDDVEETVITSDMITDVTDSYIEYEISDDGVSRKIKYVNNHVIVLFNGAQLKSYKMKDILPKEGYIRAVDTDGNGVNDIIDITSFNYGTSKYNNPARSIVVDSVAENGSLINCRADSKNNLLLSETSTISIIKNNKGYDGVGDLNPGAVVSVAESPQKVDGKTLYYLYISTKTVEGSVESIYEDAISVAGEEFRLSTNLVSSNPSLLNMVLYPNGAKVYLDCMGNAVYIEQLGEKRLIVGYVDTARKDNSFEPKGYVRIFSEDSKLVTYELAEKVYYESSNVPVPLDKVIADLTPQFVYENGVITSITNYNLIKFSFNSYGQIDRFYFAHTNENDPFEREYELYLSHHAEDTIYGYKVMGGINIGICKLMRIARDNVTGKIVENLSFVEPKIDNTEGVSNIKFYNAGIQKQAEYALISQLATSDTNGTFVKGHGSPCIFDKITGSIDADGNAGYSVYFYQNGVYKSVFGSEDSMMVNENNITKRLTDLEAGDVFLYEADTEGKIFAYSVVFSADDSLDEEGYLYLAGSGWSPYSLEVQMFKGTLYYNSNTVFTIRMKSGTTPTFYPFSNTGTVYVYKYDSARKKVYKATMSELISYSDEQNPGDRILTIGDRDNLKSVIVFR